MPDTSPALLQERLRFVMRWASVPIAMTDPGRRRTEAPAYRTGAPVPGSKPVLTGCSARSSPVPPRVSVLIACGGSSEGTVVDQGVDDIGCQAGGTMTGPVAVPVLGCVPGAGVLTAGRSRQRREYGQAPREPRKVQPHAMRYVWHERTD